MYLKDIHTKKLEQVRDSAFSASAHSVASLVTTRSILTAKKSNHHCSRVKQNGETKAFHICTSQWHGSLWMYLL